MKFSFRLEKVLRVASMEEERLEQELAAALEVEREAGATLEAVLEEYKLALEQKESLLQGRLEIQRILNINEHLDFLSQKVEHSRSYLSLTQEESVASRDRLMLAGQKRWVLEKLQEKRRKQHAFAQGRRETAMSDDIFNSRKGGDGR